MTAPITVRAERGRFVATVNADPGNFCVADTAPNALCELLANLIVDGQVTWGRVCNPQAHALIDYAQAALVDSLAVAREGSDGWALVKANFDELYGSDETEAVAVAKLLSAVTWRIARTEANLFALVALAQKINKIAEVSK